MSEQRASEPARGVLQEPYEAGAFRPRGRGGEALQQLRQALERVERESASLMRVAGSLEEFVQQQELRYRELEQELNDTALLYVASYQLHARFDAKDVLRHVRELLEQLVGVESFALYLERAEGTALPVVAKGIPEQQLTPLRAGEEPLRTAYASRTPIVIEADPLPKGTLASPLAVVPLMLGERPVGAILVLKLLGHKASWAQVDQQLFHLLSSHAASALFAAYLYQRQSDLLGALAGLGESLR